MLELCVLASGSSGNAIYVASNHTAILIDDGLPKRDLLRRMHASSLNPNNIAAVCLTHEHTDHVSGIRALHKQFPNIRLFANLGTIQALHDADRALPWTPFSEGTPFSIGPLQILAFPLPHDAGAPVGYVVETAHARLGICTDLGMPTELIRHHLQGCRTLVLEANHDEYMLQMSRRPWYLKQRIAGRMGHLSNDLAADLLLDVAGNTLSDVFLAHLSAECNTPETARTTIARRLAAAGLSRVVLHLTSQSHPSPTFACAPNTP